MGLSEQDKKRQDQMLRQFKRLDAFLNENTLRFKQEFDTHNTVLEKARLDIQRQEEESQ